jgi:hypothetical protein
MQVAILSGVYTDEAPDFRTSYPRNMVPVPKAQGISNGYLRPADGITQLATAPGLDRCGINWNGVCYRVHGNKLITVGESGAITELGDIPGTGQVIFDYSFDRLAIAADHKLFYWDGSTLQQVTDSDLGIVIDVQWVDGYFMTTDGTNLVVTELNDPFSVNPLKYGSSEADPDPIKGIIKLRNEIYAMNRHTIEVFDNVGGDNFPFQRIEGAQIPRGAIGTHACALFGGSIAFLGSGRNEAPAVWMTANGDAAKISTREIDQIVASYSEDQLSRVVVESRLDKGHQHLMIHLPDRCLVFDGAASAALGDSVWFDVDSGLVTPETYRARNFVWCYSKWLCGDPTSNAIGVLDNTISTHYGQTIGWDFGTVALYNEGRGGIIHELELVALSGRVPLGADPVIWTSYSLDGETWSLERAISAGKIGERMKRLCWRKQGRFANWRIQKFRGTSDAHLSFARLEVQIEGLNA